MLQIKSWLKESFGCEPFVTMSGNGFHVLIKIPGIILDQSNREAIQEKVKTFVHEIQNKFNDERVHIDSTFDLPRVMKCPGTLSVKGDNTPERPWRMSRIVEPNDIPSIEVFRYLNKIEPTKTEKQLGDKTPDEFDAVLQKDEKVKDLFDGNWRKYGFASRSEAEQSLLTRLITYGFSGESISTIMSQSKIGKWQEKTDAYKRTSIEKATQFVKEYQGALEPQKKEEAKYSCGENLEDKVFEQIENQEFLVFNKQTQEITKQKTVKGFQPIHRLLWKPVNDIVDYGSEQALHDEVRKYLYEHIDLADGYDLLASWLLSSWTLERWQAVPYIFFFGPAGSGKTWAMQVLASIGFRPFMSASATLASIFRVIDQWHPTMYLDETEVYMKKDRDEILNLLNAGYRKDFPAVRVEETDKGLVPRVFDVFGFKALAGTREFMQTLKSRCIILTMNKAIRKIITKIDEQRAMALRQKLLLYRFKKLV